MSLWRNIVNYVCGNPNPEEKDVVIHDFTKRSREKDLLLTKVIDKDPAVGDWAGFAFTSGKYTFNKGDYLVVDFNEDIEGAEPYYQTLIVAECVELSANMHSLILFELDSEDLQ